MSEIELLAPLLSWGLPGAPYLPAPPGDPGQLVAAAISQRVTGLVLEAANDGALAGWPDETLDRLREVHLAALRSNLQIEAAGLRAIATLEQAGLQPIWLKGGATAHLDYPDPALRSVVDVDLLLPDDQFTAALAVMTAHGCTQPIPPPSVRWERRYGKDATLLDPGGIELDVHRSLIEGYFGIGIRNDELTSATVAFEVGGYRVSALDGPSRLLHAAIHTAGSGAFRISSARDVAQLVLVSEADWTEARRRAEHWRCAALLAAGIHQAWEVLKLTDHDAVAWSRGYRPSTVERRALASLGKGGERLRMSGVWALTWWQRPSYLWPLAVPSRAHLRSRNRTYRDHLCITLRRLRGSL